MSSVVSSPGSLESTSRIARRFASVRQAFVRRSGGASAATSAGAGLGRGFGSHPGPQRQREALETRLGDLAGERLDPLPRGRHVVLELLGPLEPRRHVENAEHVDDAHHFTAVDDGNRRLAQQERHGVPARLAQHHRLRADLDVDGDGDSGARPGPGPSSSRGGPGGGEGRPCRRPRPSAARARRGGRRPRTPRPSLGRGAALHAAQHHRASDHRLERAAVAGDETVDVLRRIARRELGAPARQQFVEDGSRGHGEVLIGRVNCDA
jgi:hypothetical protein